MKNIKSKSIDEHGVVLHDSMLQLLRHYYQAMERVMPNRIYLFPDKKDEPHKIRWGCTFFKKIWSKVSDEKAVEYDLRSLYAVSNISKWENHGYELSGKLLFLSRIWGTEISKALSVISILPQCLQISSNAPVPQNLVNYYLKHLHIMKKISKTSGTFAAQNRKLAKFVLDWHTTYIPSIKTTSEHTLRSYKLSLSLLLRCLQSEKDITPFDLTPECFSVEILTQWQMRLKGERHVSATTCNSRMVAIKNLTKYIGGQIPEYAYIYMAASEYLKPMRKSNVLYML